MAPYRTGVHQVACCSHHTMWQISMAALCSLFTITPYLAADNVPAAELLLAQIKASEKAISDVVVNMQCFDRGGENKLFYHWDWGYSGGREFYSGIKYFLTDQAEFDALGTRNKVQDTNAFDGEKQYHLRLQEGSFPSGSIRAFDPSSFRGIMTPTTLLGFDARELSRQTMGEALAGAESISVKEDLASIDGHRCYVIEAVNIETDPVVNWRYDVRVWIDPERGYRPLRLEKYFGFGGNNKWQVLSRLVSDIKLERIDGIWFPVEGARTTYSLGSLTRPEGMSKQEWENLSGKQQYQMGVFSNEPMGNPRVLKIDRESVRLNRGIPEKLFRIDFPDGCVVWDEFTQMGYTVGGRGNVSLDALDADDSVASSSGNLNQDDAEDEESLRQEAVDMSKGRSSEVTASAHNSKTARDCSYLMILVISVAICLLAIIILIGLSMTARILLKKTVGLGR